MIYYLKWKGYIQNSVVFTSRDEAQKFIDEVENPQLRGGFTIETLEPIEIIDLLQKFERLRTYLNSDKFNQDIMVNKNDILLRLNGNS